MKKVQSNVIDLNSCAIEKTFAKFSEKINTENGENFSFVNSKNFTPITMKKDYGKNNNEFFQVGDDISIYSIKHRGKDKTIEVKFIHSRNAIEVSKMEMSGAIFLQYFLASIDLENLVLNEVTEEVKVKVEKLIEDIENIKDKSIKKAEKKGGLDILKIFKRKKSKD
ncbi:MAG: hypothetical protein PHS49_04925 [Candidatus Gracilibacteria bacterium]|nr:hypothetical protein [Candidatus Gracilibacteria bacterium]